MPVRYCADCGTPVGRRWQEFIRCVPCQRKVGEQIRLDFAAGTVERVPALAATPLTPWDAYMAEHPDDPFAGL
jgi:hypothetical protein